MRTKIILLILLLIAGCLLAQENRATIAVLDFTNETGQAKYNYLQRTLSENIITTFAGSKNFIVVERFRMDEYLNEMNLGQAGIVNEQTASKIGQALGADQIILGSYSLFGDNLQVNARLIDVETIRIKTAKRYTGTNEQLLVEEVAAKLLIELTPDEAEKEEVRRDLQARQAIFKSQIKNPMLAMAGGMTIPILGHAYVGGSFNLIRGGLYTLADILFLTMAISNADEDSDDAMMLGIWLTVLTNVISGTDAGISAALHNKKVRKQGFAIQFMPNPARNKYSLSLSYRF